MNKPFRIDLAGVGVELGGNTVILDKDNQKEDRPGELFDFFRSKEHVSHTENYAVLRGNPENGVMVEVLEHVFRDDTMITVLPFSTKNGTSKFSSQNDLYVVFSKDREHRIFVVCHRKFPTGIIFWDAGTRKKLPAEKSEGKPLTAHPELPAELAPKNGGDGHGEQSDIVDPHDIAGAQTAGRRTFAS